MAGSRLRVLDGSTLEVLAAGPDNVLAISPANMLAAIHNPTNQTCTIWNITSRERGPSMEVGVISQARFSPDGKMLATWANWASPILQLWNTDTGERIERFEVGRPSEIISVMSVAYSPDGHYLAADLQFNDIGVYDLVRKTWSIHTFSNEPSIAQRRRVFTPRKYSGRWCGSRRRNSVRRAPTVRSA